MKPSLLPLLALHLPLLAGPAQAQHAEALGRLFLTPAQRASLDHQRQFPQAEPDRRPEGEGTLIVNGEVRRSDGRNTRWINGKAESGGLSPAPGLPVGDRFDPATGQRESLLGNGRITVKPAPAGR